MLPSWTSSALMSSTATPLASKKLRQAWEKNSHPWTFYLELDNTSVEDGGELKIVLFANNSFKSSIKVSANCFHEVHGRWLSWMFVIMASLVLGFFWMSGTFWWVTDSITSVNNNPSLSSDCRFLILCLPWNNCRLKSRPQNVWNFVSLMTYWDISLFNRW